MRRFNLLLISSVLLFSCGGNESEENKNGDYPATDSGDEFEQESSRGENVDEELYCFDESWQSFKGTIDNQHEIVVEVGRTFYTNSGKFGMRGFYFYTSNNSGFELHGEQDKERVTLERYKEGEVDETFYWEYDGDMNIFGWWKKEGSDQLDIQIEELKFNHDRAEPFLNGVLEITSNPMTSDLTMSFQDLEELHISEYGCLQATEDFDGYHHGQKIRLDGYYENSGGGHTDDAIYVLLPRTEDEELLQIAQIEYMNMWENDYHDYDIDEDDEYGINPAYFVSLKVFDFKGDEMEESQNLVWEGDGEANAYYFENRLVVLATDRKEVVYFSTTEGAFVEH